MLYFYIYLLFGVVSAIWLAVECFFNQGSWLWALVALFVPFILPFYFLKKMRGNQMKRVGAWIVVFIVFVFIEASLIVSTPSKPKYTNRIEKQALIMVEKLKKNADLLDTQMENLEIMSKSEKSKSQILNSIAFISMIQKKSLKEFNKNRDTFVAFTDAYSMQIKRDNLDFIIDLKDYYNCHYDSKNMQRLDKYLYTFKKVMFYAAQHVKNIKERKKTSLQSYDALYVAYRGAVDKYYKSELQRMAYMQRFLKKYPEFSKYLPEKRKLSSLFLWSVN